MLDVLHHWWRPPELLHDPVRVRKRVDSGMESDMELTDCWGSRGTYGPSGGLGIRQ